MKEVFFGLLAAAVGLCLTFYGYRLARFILPIWGLVAGFTIGASATADALGKQFIGTTLGIIIGLILGLVFAVFAYFFYSLAVVLLGASVGYWIGTGFITLLGFHSGFLAAVVGIIIGALFAIMSIAFNIPKYFLVLVTAIGGTVATVGGVLLMFHKIPLDSFNYAATTLAVTSSWFWALSAIVLLAIGAVYQFISNPDFVLTEWGTLDTDKPKRVKAKVK
ncbi:MAG: DUF4203 domain-containing protein [Prolixibacteraceae bacterium]|nr:DUF4203 domain-containing protein [Prolixibacteraceae bacterium]